MEEVWQGIGESPCTRLQGPLSRLALQESVQTPYGSSFGNLGGMGGMGGGYGFGGGGMGGLPYREFQDVQHAEWGTWGFGAVGYHL